MKTIKQEKKNPKEIICKNELLPFKEKNETSKYK